VFFFFFFSDSKTRMLRRMEGRGFDKDVWR